MNQVFHNYEMDFLGHCIVTTNDKGIIVEISAIPFRKYIGRKLDDVVSELSKRSSFHGLKDLGKTTNEVLKMAR